MNRIHAPFIRNRATNVLKHPSKGHLSQGGIPNPLSLEVQNITQIQKCHADLAVLMHSKGPV